MFLHYVAQIFTRDQNILKFTIAVTCLVAAAEAATIHPELLATLNNQGSSDIIVQLKKDPIAREWADSKRFATRGERGTALKGYLQAVTSKAQRPVLDAINAMPEDMESARSYWISNAIWSITSTP